MPRIPFHLTLTRRVWALAALALVTMALGTGVALYRFQSAMLDLRQAELRSEADIAADWLKSGLPADAPDSKAAVRAALERLRPARFGENGYFFAISFDGVSLLAPTSPQIEGTSLLGVRDSAGGLPFETMLNLARKDGGGLVSYPWPKPGADGPREKTSYVRAIPELGLAIGSGLYFDDNLADLVEIAIAVALAVLPLLLLFLVVAFFVGRTISRRLKALTSGLERHGARRFRHRLAGP